MYNDYCTVQYTLYIILHICAMNVYEYLKNEPDVPLAIIARRMYPGTKTAPTRLSHKLSGKRAFTQRDAELAMQALQQTVTTIGQLELGEGYPRK